MIPGRASTGALAGLFSLILITAVSAVVPAAQGTRDGMTPAARVSSSIERFSGAWVGKTTDETAVERNATLTIDPMDDGGFTVTWTSFEAPTTTDGGIVRRDRKLEFIPTKTQGLFRAVGDNDPVAALAAWAHLDGDVLSVSIIAVQPDGRLEHQIYDRTVAGDELFLSYRRYLNTDLVRMLDVKYVRL